VAVQVAVVVVVGNGGGGEADLVVVEAGEDAVFGVVFVVDWGRVVGVVEGFVGDEDRVGAGFEVKDVEGGDEHDG